MRTPLLIRFIFSPAVEFERLKENPLPLGYTFSRIHLPLVLISAFIVILGVTANEEGISPLTLHYFVYTTIKWVLSIYLSAWAVNRLVSAFKGTKNIRNVYTLMVVSTVFVVLALSVSFVMPERRSFVSLFSLVGLYHFYQGAIIFTSIRRERTVGFLLISLLIFAINTVFFEFFLGILFGIPIHL